MKHASLALALALALAPALAACSKGGGAGGDDGKVASCHAAEINSCEEYNSSNLALGSKHIQELCTVLVKTAVFSEKPCPAENRIGSCQRDEGKNVYYTGTILGEPAKLEKQCTERGGTWAK